MSGEMRLRKRYGKAIGPVVVHTYGVLAGAYAGRGRRHSNWIEGRPMLTHAVLGDEEKSLCGRLDIGRLADYDMGVPPTCPSCRKKYDKLITS